MNRRWFGLAVLAGALLAPGASVWAEARAQPPDPRDEGMGAEARRAEIRQRMLELFGRRLRAELALTDQQFEAIMPLVRALEEERARHMREQRRLRMELHRAYREGAPDERLEELLEMIEAAQREHLQEVERRMREIDEHLTVRQRVQFRAFLERFRNEMRRRVEGFRERRHLGGPPPGPRRPR